MSNDCVCQSSFVIWSAAKSCMNAFYIYRNERKIGNGKGSDHTASSPEVFSKKIE